MRTKAGRKRSLNLGLRLIIGLGILLLLLIVVLMFDLHLDIEASLRQCITKHSNDGFFGTFKRRDKFHDLMGYLKMSRDGYNPAPFEYVIIPTRDFGENPSLAEMFNHTVNENDTSLEKFQWAMRRHSVYEKNDPLIPPLLHDLATLPIVDARAKPGGTQIKLVLEFPGKIFALFKPMRYPRDRTTRVNHIHYTDFERHHSEIASFHLDMALGFRRSMPVVGRRINMRRDIFDHDDPAINQTFFISPANNLCFYGNCLYYCNILYPVCSTKGEVLEGSLAAFVPQFQNISLKARISPWKRSYSFYHDAIWEGDETYCYNVQKNHTLFREGRRLLDLTDLSVFDFLIQNGDRHSFDYLDVFGNDSAPLTLDNGRGFGRPFTEDYLILAPLLQCCLIREATLRTLLKYQNGPKRLSQVMRQSLKKDPLAPVLWEPYYEALDRRVELILIEVRKCVEKHENHRKVVHENIKEYLDTMV